MGFIEEDNFRDDKGRLLPGHGGLKKPGSKNRLQAEIKNKITEFLAGKVESLEEIYSEVSPKDKLRFLTELLAYILPKSKEIEIIGKSPEAEADLTRLSDQTLKELISIQNKITNELNEDLHT